MNNKVYPEIEDDLDVDSILQEINGHIDKIVVNDNANHLSNKLVHNSSLNSATIIQSKSASTSPVRMGRSINTKKENEVSFIHELDDPVSRATEATDSLRQQFSNLKEQLNLYKQKFEETVDKNNATVKQLVDAQLKCDKLEEELQEQIRNTQIANRATGSNARKGLGVNDLAQSRIDILRTAIADDDDGLQISFGKVSGEFQYLKLIFFYFNRYFYPFKSLLKNVDSKFGSSVASYLIFYRFIFLQFVSTGIAAIIFAILHIQKMLLDGHNIKSIISSNISIPSFMKFSSYKSSEASLYIIFVIVVSGILLISVIFKIIAEDKNGKELDALDKESESHYAKEVLCYWDNTQSSLDEVKNLRGSIRNLLVQLLEETKAKGVKSRRSKLGYFMLYMRRFFAFIIYLSLQGASFAVIVFATIKSGDIRKQVPAALGAFIIPIIINVINKVVPELLQLLTEFEQWDTGDFFVNILLFRMYVFNILNQVALALSYILLADPFLLAQYPSLRSSLELPFSSSRYECRIDEAADQLFSLVVSGFVTNNTLLFAIPYAKKCLFYVLNKPLRKVPFDIVGLIVDLNGFVGQILLAIPFVPLVSLLTPIIIYFNVLFQYYAFMWFYRKPERPWKAQKAGAVFTYFYLITVLLLGCSATVYFLTSPTFPKSCDIQDDFPQLCSSSTLDTSNDCTLDKSSDYYKSYSNDYPAQICDYACGAFVDYRNNLRPFRDYVFEYYILKLIWYWLFSQPYVPYILMIILCIMVGLLRNSSMVTGDYATRRERLYESKLEILEAEKRKAVKQLQRFKVLNVSEEAS